MNTHDLIAGMPKVELHLHLEGAFTLEFLFRQIQKYHGSQEIDSLQALKKRFILRDFNHFIETWFWKNRFFRSPEDFEQSTYQTLKCLSAQNVVHVEAFFSPWDFAESGLSAKDIISSTIAGKNAAENDFGISCYLLADLVRDHGYLTAPERLNDLKYFRGEIKGIGLGGNENMFQTHFFADVFREARNAGFHCVAHAGEAAGSESVWDAINILHAERIGHGINAVYDRELMNNLKLRQIPLEICPTSNIMTKVVDRLEHHPVKQFFRDGILVTINSDDPTMFNTTITNEYLLLHDKLQFKLNDIFQLSLNGVKASFLDSAGKAGISESILQYWNTHNFQES